MTRRFSRQELTFLGVVYQKVLIYPAPAALKCFEKRAQRGICKTNPNGILVFERPTRA